MANYNPSNPPPPIKTTEEARKKGRNGGIKSGEARRRKKSMQELAQVMLDCKLNSHELKGNFAELGFCAEKMTMAEAMLAGQIAAAITGKGGDPRAFKAILDLIEPVSDQGAAIAEYNAKMRALAELINHPAQDRSLTDFEGDGEGAADG